jgi:hypothetical protein
VNFHALLERCGDPAEHGKGMAFVIGIFQPADNRCGRSDKLGELALGKAGFRPQLENFPRHVPGRAHLLKRSEALRAAGVVAPMQNAKAVFCLFGCFDDGCLRSHICEHRSIVYLRTPILAQAAQLTWVDLD